MPTPSEDKRRRSRGGRADDWAAHPGKPGRSVFDNYRPSDPESGSRIGRDRSVRPAAGSRPASPGSSLQADIDVALARSFLYRFLAQAYEDPTREGWETMTAAEWRQCFDRAVHPLAVAAPALADSARAFRSRFRPEAFEEFRSAALAAFGHAARGRCPLNEIEYGDLKADPLFQPHRLADLAAFYRAFGLEVAGDAGERQDHICLELEFMCVLAAKEAYALEHQLGPGDLSLCRRAQQQFLREHLGRWAPAFARCLARMAGGTALGALAALTGAFIESDCAHCGVVPGGRDLLLRPVDETAESLCGSCGLVPLPPGGLGPARS